MSLATVSDVHAALAEAGVPIAGVANVLDVKGPASFLGFGGVLFRLDWPADKRPTADDLATACATLEQLLDVRPGTVKVVSDTAMVAPGADRR